MNYSPYHRSIDALMDAAGRYQVPSAAEEKKLVRAAKRGDAQATHTLVLGHLRLVIKIANTFSNHNVDLFEELAAAGVAGMIQAIPAFKPSQSGSGRFMHYAVFHVRRQMRRVLNDYRTPVTANPNNYDLARKIFAYEEEVLKTEGRQASHEEIGKKFGLTPNRVERAKKLLEKPMYLDHAASTEDERNGHDVCADKNATAPSVLAELNMEAEMLRKLMKEHLNGREIAILERRFGLDSGETEDLYAIGRDFNLSRERVRQIEAAALKKLRFHLSQLCPTYRERAGVHPSVVPSKLPLQRPAAPVVVASKRCSDLPCGCEAQRCELAVA